MPGIDYVEIRNKIADVIKSISCEINISFDTSNVSDLSQLVCFVEYYSRTLHTNQKVAAGTRTRYNISIKLTVLMASLDLYESQRTVLGAVSQIETALMANRQLDGLVSTLSLQGGELASAFEDTSGYHATGAEIDVLIDAEISI